MKSSKEYHVEWGGLATMKGSRSPLVAHNGQDFGHQDLQQHSQLEKLALTNRTQASKLA